MVAINTSFRNYIIYYTPRVPVKLVELMTLLIPKSKYANLLLHVVQMSFIYCISIKLYFSGYMLLTTLVMQVFSAHILL